MSFTHNPFRVLKIGTHCVHVFVPNIVLFLRWFKIWAHNSREFTARVDRNKVVEKSSLPAGILIKYKKKLYSEEQIL